MSKLETAEEFATRIRAAFANRADWLTELVRLKQEIERRDSCIAAEARQEIAAYVAMLEAWGAVHNQEVRDLFTRLANSALKHNPAECDVSGCEYPECAAKDGK